jgi:hypothetical protein
MPPTDFFGFLTESLDLLDKESRESYLRLVSALGGLRASISTGAKKRLVYFDGDRFVVATDLLNPDIEVVFRDDAVIDLIDGNCSLEQAVLNDAIFVRGAMSILEKFYFALGIYLQCALRSRSFPALLSRYRQAVATEE